MSHNLWPSEWADRAEKLAQTGMYSLTDEHDACGVGLVTAIDGEPRREVVTLAIEALKNVWHRGAVDADGKTGDGAGIHLHIPRAFFADELGKSGVTLAPESLLGVGMVFLPKKKLSAQDECRAIIESEIQKFGHHILGWRQVPIDATIIGDIANDSRPEIEQVLIGSSKKIDRPRFELELYLIRRNIEQQARQRSISDIYLCSLSSRSIIYKGLFRAEQLTAFYPDLLDERFTSSFAIFHQRFSTNTAPAWHLAQPFRCIAHNGEINTLRSNVNFMKSHEATMDCEAFASHEDTVRPVVQPNVSDTAALDNVMELLVRAGHPIPLAKQILVPPAWSHASDMPQAHKDMFACLNTVSEPWDGPAAIAGTDGTWVIAGMDRNGLRPMRYALTDDGLLVIGSESGMVPVAPERVLEKGRLGPGDTIGVNLREGKLYRDQELKDTLANDQPYHEWASKITQLSSAAPAESTLLPRLDSEALRQLHTAVGMTFEELELILQPMAETGKEAIGSMGDDTTLAMLARRPRGFHHFFRQQFSQVTNPPIDALREHRTMSLKTRFGNDGNFLSLNNSYHKSVVLETPYLLSYELDNLKADFSDKVRKIDTLFDASGNDNALRRGLDALVQAAESAVRAGKPYLLLTDEHRNAQRAAIPMILAVAAVNTHLVSLKLRKRASIIVRSAECFDVHHFAVLIGCGATVVNAYLAEETILHRYMAGLLGKNTAHESLLKFKDAMSAGLLKIMSKIGISVVSSYRNGCNFEVIGLSRSLANEFFPGIPSRLSGYGLRGIEARLLKQHAAAYENKLAALPVGGFYRHRAGQDIHRFEGESVHLMQTAVTKGDYPLFKKYSAHVAAQRPINIRQLLDFSSSGTPIALDKVEPVTEILKRFAAPAMSLGALSKEAHETLAIAMNRINAMCNSGEGGEDAARFTPYPNGDLANSNVKQVASARFGVTAHYLNNAKELQIKVAQGAKPGEGGQLPGFKVTEMIAKLRHATPGVTLISPPPHHDIYSIEDLAQLIYDLKQINPDALVSVKLVSQAGIGTVASGVVKALADKIIISGNSGGTGASPLSSIKFAGTPWEMGLSEVQQVLTLNRLRHRVRLQTDGGITTGRDVAVAALLGAEEYAVGTAALVAMGCLIVRQCHSNTCPVGICTQDEDLRAKFGGSPEKVINLFTFIAEELREIMAQLGFAKLDDMIGRSDLLTQVKRGSEDLVDLDLNPLLVRPDGLSGAQGCTMTARNIVPDTLDKQILEDVKTALETAMPIVKSYTIHNTQRTIGARLSSAVVRRFGIHAPQADLITLKLQGSAGQSLGAFLNHGIRIEVEGDANDYVGKGLSGGVIVVRPNPSAKFKAEDNAIVGNTVLYGATSGKFFANGQAGERFAVRNSGATAVVEGCGAGGCEYMTGGLVAILGLVGDNFGAGMSGGMAFVFDPAGAFEHKVNADMVVWARPETAHWQGVLKGLLEEHLAATNSPLAARLLKNFEAECSHFWQICPKEMLSRLENPVSHTAKAA